MTKILLVEDDKSLREIYGVRLLAEGYDIVSAGDGEEALAMAIKEKPQLIISDVMMPKISGFDMLDILRSTTETRDIKVIMMTALSSEDQRARGEQLGADKYLVKSQVGIEDVVRTVHEVLGDSSNGAPATASTDNKDSAPATDTTAPTETPPADKAGENPNEKKEDNMQPTDNTNSAVPPVESTDTAPASPPGNEDAGPLPPQPTETEVEHTLPQPTAPFSSPAPSSLGEQITQPEAPSVDNPVESVLPPVNPVESEPVTPSDPVQPPISEAVDTSAPTVGAEPAVEEPTVSVPPVADPVTFEQPTVTPAPTEGMNEPSTDDTTPAASNPVV